MIGNKIVLKIGLLAALAAGLGAASAAPKKTEPGIQLTEAGKQLEAKYAAMLTSLKVAASAVGLGHHGIHADAGEIGQVRRTSHEQ